MPRGIDGPREESVKWAAVTAIISLALCGALWLLILLTGGR